MSALFTRPAYRRGMNTVFIMTGCLLLFVLMSAPVNAEIYRWRDNDGTIRFSNVPPEDETLILNVIPTRRVPLVEDGNGTVYYLNVPEGEFKDALPMKEMLEQVTLPPDVLERLLVDAAAQEDASSAAQSPSLEKEAGITLRLTELEKALEREITRRLEWEQKYVLSKAQITTLEKQNDNLKRALTTMKEQIEKLEASMTISDITHIATFRIPQPQRGAIGEIASLQAALELDASEDPDAVALIQQEVEQLKSTQRHNLDELSDQLRTLEANLNALKENASDKAFTAVSSSPSPEEEPTKAAGSEDRLHELLQKQARRIYEQEQHIATLQKTMEDLQQQGKVRIYSVNLLGNSRSMIKKVH